MFPQIEGNAKKQPKANNEHVQEEIRKEEDQNLVQPGSNEAVMSYMLNKMLNAANSDNMLDLDAYADQEEEIIPYNGKSDNIVNDNNIINNNNIMNNNNNNNNIINDRKPSGGIKENNDSLAGSELEIDTRSDETKKREKEEKANQRKKLREPTGRSPVWIRSTEICSQRQD